MGLPFPVKELQEALFQEAGTENLQDAGKANLLQGRKGSQLVCVCKPLFGSKRFAYTTGELQFFSEDRRSSDTAVYLMFPL